MKRLPYIIAVLMSCLAIGGAQEPGATISLTWDNPTNSVAGTPLVAPIVSNVLYRGTSPNVYNWMKTVVPSQTDAPLVLGKINYFAVSAIDANSVESALSEELAVPPVPAWSGKPSGLRTNGVTITKGGRTVIINIDM